MTRPRDSAIHRLPPEIAVAAETNLRLRNPPTSILQALMETAPGATPNTSWEDMQPVRDAVKDCIEQLSEQDQHLVHQTFYHQKSQREAGRTIAVGKSTAHRYHTNILNQLRPLMENHPVIRTHLGLPNTWNEACQQVVDGLWKQVDSLGEYWRLPNEDQPSLNHIDEAIIMWPGFANYPKDRDEYAVELLELAAIEAILRTGDYPEGYAVTADGIVDVLVAKHHDYGSEAITRFGVFGILVRLSDKVARYRNLVELDDEPANETIIDTLLDVVGYVTICKMLVAGTFTLPLADCDPQVGIEAVAA